MGAVNVSLSYRKQLGLWLHSFAEHPWSKSVLVALLAPCIQCIASKFVKLGFLKFIKIHEFVPFLKIRSVHNNSNVPLYLDYMSLYTIFVKITSFFTTSGFKCNVM